MTELATVMGSLLPTSVSSKCIITCMLDRRRSAELCILHSVIRCLVSAVAFGMGVYIPDIRYVILWGGQRFVVTYWPHIGKRLADVHGMVNPGKPLFMHIQGHSTRA